MPQDVRSKLKWVTARSIVYLFKLRYHCAVCLPTLGSNMSFTVSDRSKVIQPSATLVISQKARELRATGVNVISLSAGEPDFPTPEHIKQAAIDAIHANHTHYTNVDGIPELKTAIVNKFKNENQLDFSTDEILVSVGAKHSLANLFQALLNPGDEAIVPAPYWVSYPDMIALTGAMPVVIHTDIHQSLKITPDQLEKAITPRTKLVILNSPSNPSGAEYTADELVALGAVIKKHPNTMIVCDDIYEHLRWDDKPFYTLLNVCPELREQTIVINGLSKAYAMTGWRIGYAAGPAELIKAMKKLQSQCTSNPCSISQYAAVAALNGGLESIKPMVAAFEKRSRAFVDDLNKISGFKCLQVKAALYAFPNVEEVIKRLGLKDDVAFAEFLLEKAHVAVVPGTAFGLPGYIRMSFATSEELLREAARRIKNL